MKRRLNILCVLVMLVLGYSVFESTIYLGSAMIDGARAGYNDAKNGGQLRRDVSGMKAVVLFSDDFANLKDSVFNEKSGAFVPVGYSQLAVNVETEPNIWLKLISTLSSLLYLVISIVAVVLFVKFIISINRSCIFEWVNVRRLRWMGAALVLSFICSTVPFATAFYELSGVFQVPGYSLTIYGAISSLTLVLGLMSLIVAEVFAIGLRMKEEQDLTI